MNLRGLLLTLLIALPMALKAGGEKWQLTLVLSPSTEWLYFRNTLFAKEWNSYYGSKLSYNFGLEYKRFFDPSLSLSTGFLYQNKGFRNTYQEQARNQTGEFIEGVTLGSAHFVGVPLYLNFHSRMKRKTELIFTVGLAGSYLLSQTVRNKQYTGEVPPQEGLFDVSEGVSNINFFRDFHLGFHTGLGISKYIKSRVVLIVQPMFKYQVNDGRDPFFPSNDLFSAKLNSFSIDFKIGYFFTKQIRNKRKRL